MNTFTVQVEVPEEFRELGFTPETVREAVPKLLVLQRFREGVIDSGRAAELLGLTRVEFLELLSKEKIPVFDLTEQELSDDFEMARKLASSVR